MTFADAIKICFNKYADFNGRAARPEFWYFFLFTLLVSLGLNIITQSMGGAMVGMLFSLATLVPSLAVGARRLHDTNRSGWLQLIWLIPLIGWIILIIFLAQEGKDGNAYGPAPHSGEAELLS